MGSFYDSYDDLIFKICPGYRGNLDGVVGLIPEGRHRIVDLGSGTGNLALRILESRDVEITGVELQKELVDIAVRKDKFGKARFLCRDFREFDFKGYSGVVSALALHHFTRDEKEVLYQRIVDHCRYFINYDRVLTVDEAGVRRCYFEFMRENGISEDLVEFAKLEMETKDNPLPLDEELVVFRLNGWKIEIDSVDFGFAVYKACSNLG